VAQNPPPLSRERMRRDGKEKSLGQPAGRGQKRGEERRVPLGREVLGTSVRLGHWALHPSLIHWDLAAAFVAAQPWAGEGQGWENSLKYTILQLSELGWELYGQEWFWVPVTLGP